MNVSKTAKERLGDQKKSYEVKSNKKSLKWFLTILCVLIFFGGGLGLGWFLWHKKPTTISGTPDISAIVKGEYKVNVDVDESNYIQIKAYNNADIINKPCHVVGMAGVTWKDFTTSDGKILALDGKPTVEGECNIAIAIGDDLSTEQRATVLPASLDTNIYIDENTIDIKNNYKIVAGTPVYGGAWDSANIISNDLINLKALSDDNNGATNFIVSQSINYGFLVDPSMDCHLSAINDATVTILNDAAHVGGAIVGVVVASLNNTYIGRYSHSLVIDSSMMFNVSSSSSSDSIDTYGVLFFDTSAKSDQIINGFFSLTTSYTGPNVASIACIKFNNAGTFYFDGVCKISTKDKGSLLAFYIVSQDNDSFCVVDGLIFLSTTQYTGINAIYITSGSHAIILVYALFYIDHKATSSSDSILRISNVNSKFILILKGVCTVESTYFNVLIINIINNNISITNEMYVAFSSFGTATKIINSFYYSSSNANIDKISINVIDANFFSNIVDSTNLFSLNAAGVLSYKWNGANITRTTNTTTADNTLSFVLLTDHDISVYALGTATDNNKVTFNTMEKQFLENYISGSICPIAVRPWLENIITQIPIS